MYAELDPEGLTVEADAAAVELRPAPELLDPAAVEDDPDAKL